MFILCNYAASQTKVKIIKTPCLSVASLTPSQAEPCCSSYLEIFSSRKRLKVPNIGHNCLVLGKWLYRKFFSQSFDDIIGNKRAKVLRHSWGWTLRGFYGNSSQTKEAFRTKMANLKKISDDTKKFWSILQKKVFCILSRKWLLGEVHNMWKPNVEYSFHLHAIVRPNFKFSTLGFNVNFTTPQLCQIRCHVFSVISVHMVN